MTETNYEPTAWGLLKHIQDLENAGVPSNFTKSVRELTLGYIREIKVVEKWGKLGEGRKQVGLRYNNDNAGLITDRFTKEKNPET
jgi:hypothetical protein